MRWFFLVILSVCFFNEPAFAQARSVQASVARGFPFTAEVVSGRVNIRAGQNNNFESVAILPKGTLLTVLGKKFKWYKVFLPADAKAFVKTEYIRLLTPDLGEVTVDRLNVRCAPNTDATTVGQLTQGRKFFIKENQGAWLWIKPVDGVYGWVHEPLLVFKDNGPVPMGEADPDALAAVKASEARAQQARQEAKTALLKKSADGFVECSGRLKKLEGGPVAYKVFRDNMAVCFVDGPQSVLDGFVGADVRVEGKLKSVPPDADAGIVGLSKIRQAL